MSSVFTIHFNFEEKLSKALVRFYEKGYNIFFSIQVLNEELHSILPAGKLAFSFAEGMQVPANLTHRKGPQLVRCITDEIAHYLSRETPLVRC